MNSILASKQMFNSTYEVQFFMGGDSFVEKYRVKDQGGKLYLLKLYDSSKLSSQDFSHDGLLEVEILGSLHVDNVVKLIAQGEYVHGHKKYHYVVVDFISGESLEDKLKREGTLSQYSAVSMITSLLETLVKVHGKATPIIHNNINLNSVYLDYSRKPERPVLTELNFSRYITSKSNTLDLHRLPAHYIAPELYNGIFTPQSDIFSVGALLYNLIFGLPPWHIEIPKYQHTDEKFIDAITAKRKHPLNFRIQKHGELEDEHLKKVISKALATNVDDRFNNAAEFINALNGEEILSNKAPTEERSHEREPVKSGSGFSAIAGMQELKDILYNDIIRALNEKELYASYGVTIPNGMLLYGPPGCGKTFISERFAEEVGFNIMELKPSDIKSQYINATEGKIRSIFKDAIEKAPTIIFIDEIDAVVPNRESGLHQMQAGPVNEFLAQMSNCSEKGIFIIAASNRPEKIDPAILRTGRIDRIIYLPPPDYDARVAMFKLYLKKRPVDLGMNYNKLAEMTENYVTSDIKYLIDQASRLALKTRARITLEIFTTVIAETRPSVSIVELKRYERLKEQLEENK